MKKVVKDNIELFVVIIIFIAMVVMTHFKLKELKEPSVVNSPIVADDSLWLDSDSLIIEHSKIDK